MTRPPADLSLVDAIKQAAANIGGAAEDQDGIIAWLEYIRCRDERMFNALITKWRKDLPPWPK